VAPFGVCVVDEACQATLPVQPHSAARGWGPLHRCSRGTHGSCPPQSSPETLNWHVPPHPSPPAPTPYFPPWRSPVLLLKELDRTGCQALFADTVTHGMSDSGQSHLPTLALCIEHLTLCIEQLALCVRTMLAFLGLTACMGLLADGPEPQPVTRTCKTQAWSQCSSIPSTGAHYSAPLPPI